MIDHYGPLVPIGGGAIFGKDPHKVDKCGALGARQLAKQLVRAGVDEARVTLGWTPGGDRPFHVEADHIRATLIYPVRRELFESLALVHRAESRAVISAGAKQVTLCLRAVAFGAAA